MPIPSALAALGNPGLRLRILLAVAGASAVASVLQWPISREAAELATPTRHPRPVLAAPGVLRATPAPVASAASRPQWQAAAAANPFSTISWLPPAAPVTAVKKAAPEPPRAPDLPYRFVGMLEDSARPSAFLARGDALMVVKAGDTVDGQYRVDQLGPQAIVLTYLPLKQQQQIRLSGEHQ